MKHSRNVSTSIGRILHAFRSHIGSEKARLLGGAAFILLATAMDVIQPWPLKFIYDHIFGKSGSHWPTLPSILLTMDSRILLAVFSLSLILMPSRTTPTSLVCSSRTCPMKSNSV